MDEYYRARAAWKAGRSPEAVALVAAGCDATLELPSEAATWAEALSGLIRQAPDPEGVMAWIWEQDPRALWISWLQEEDLSGLPAGGRLHQALVRSAASGWLSGDERDVPNGGRAALPISEIPEAWGAFGEALGPALEEARAAAPGWGAIAAQDPEAVLARFFHDFILDTHVTIFIFRLGAIRREHTDYAAAVAAAADALRGRPDRLRELLALHAGRRDVQDPVAYLDKLRRLLGAT